MLQAAPKLHISEEGQEEMIVRIAVAVETEDAAIVAVLLEYGGTFLSSAGSTWLNWQNLICSP